MDLLKILKCLVFIISFVMFIYQLKTATQLLMDPPTVDFSYERDITVDDFPLITVCPTNQMIYHYSDGGNGTVNHVLLGITDCGPKTNTCTAWGSQVNLTFDEIKSQTLDYYESVEQLDIDGAEFQSTKVFLPSFGFCKETLPLKFTKKFVLYYLDHSQFDINTDDARVLITHRNYSSYFMPYVESHVGSTIFMKPLTRHLLNVKIYERYTCKDGEKQMSQEDFKKCVDDKIQKEFKKNNISCLPPWLSYNKQCDQTYPHYSKFYGKFYEDLEENYIEMVEMLINIRFEEECRQSCKETTYFVKEKGRKERERGSNACITFDQKVSVTKNVANYDMFKYIIDVGSSLGLWLGLSVLGLHNLVVWAVQFVNNSFIIKKIRSCSSHKIR